MIIRQGDITLIRTGDVPKNPKGKAKPTIIAKGEESGHWHSANVIDKIEAGVRTLIVPQDTVMRVEPESHANRHEPVTIPAGVYTIPGAPDDASIWLGQREYTPEEVRGVAD